MMNPANYLLSASEQDYLKTIYTQTRSGQPTSTVALAAALEVRAASVTNMLQKLAESHPELVSYRKHYGVLLTPEGEKAALQIVRRHRLIEQFLYQILEFPLDRIHEEAEELEHVVSPYFIDRLAALLDDPAYDPHGDPIPDSNSILVDPRRLVLLADLRAGEGGIVRQITDQDSEMLVFLHSIGIFPNAELMVVQLNPLDGTQQVRVGEKQQTEILGKAISSHVKVEIQPH